MNKMHIPTHARAGFVQAFKQKVGVFRAMQPWPAVRVPVKALQTVVQALSTVPYWQNGHAMRHLRAEYRDDQLPPSVYHLAGALRVLARDQEAIISERPDVQLQRDWLIYGLAAIVEPHSIKVSAGEYSRFVDLVRIAYRAGGLDVQSARADIRRNLKRVKTERA